MNLITHFCKLDRMTSRAVTTTFGGLSRMKVKWDSLPPATRQDLYLTIGKVAKRLNDREVGNLLHSMTRVGITWDSIPESVRNDLLGNHH